MPNLNLTRLIDNANYCETVCQLRWQSGVCCPKCSSAQVIKCGKNDTQPYRQRYQGKGCSAHFDLMTHYT